MISRVLLDPGGSLFSRVRALLLAIPTCASCGRGGGALCAQCQAAAGIGARLHCLPQLCGGATDAAYAVALYRTTAGALSPVAELLWRFKYCRDRRCGRVLAHLVARRLPRLEAPVDLVVPVPLSQARLEQRGFNQAAWLARAVAKRLDIPMRPDVLARRPGGTRQVGLRARQRRALGQRANPFYARPLPDCGGRVLLVDDVITTGATVGAAARALKRAGARRVLALALCAVPYSASPSKWYARPPSVNV
ncbi:MAG: ComF family protein [Candidatus Dadabacteria bacterium]|nr:MAG: ComF family protein [Candidatus Dadabacteria bacterium]